jgi:hypothetical protein
MAGDLPQFTVELNCNYAQQRNPMNWKSASLNASQLMMSIRDSG